MYLDTKGGEIIQDTTKKSRAKYFQERRKDKASFSVLIDKEKGLAIEEHLKKTNQTKTKWLENKIDQDTKKMS